MIKSWLKRKYISYKACNTDSWIVQTTNTEACLRKALPTTNKDVYILPFYYCPQSLRDYDVNAHRQDYILVGNYTGTRGHDELVKAWEILYEKGFNPKLHLTVSHTSSFASVIDNAVSKGINIENHGLISFEALEDLYHRCKATVYPSINESLGLGIVEAIEAGCDVIGANQPYVYSICEPSGVFENNAKSIAQAIIQYETTEHNKSKLTITSQENELIDLLGSCSKA